jgi:hypothetical protein
MQRDNGRLTSSDGRHRYHLHRFFAEDSAHQQMVWEVLDDTPYEAPRVKHEELHGLL